MPNTSYDAAADLQEACRDPAALSRLVEAEHPRVVAWLERILRDGELAEDAMQETWLTISGGKWSFAPQSEDAAGDVRAWLKQIALRSALRLRARQHTYLGHLRAWWLNMPVHSPAPTPLECIAAEDARDLVRAVVAELPLAVRESLELRFRAGLSFAAIGQAQGCTELTARVRTWRGLAQVRRRLLTVGIIVMPGSLLASLAADGVPVLALASAAGVTLSMPPFRKVLMAGGVVIAAVGWWMASSHLMAEESKAEEKIDKTTSTNQEPPAATSMAYELRPWGYLPRRESESAPHREAVPRTESSSADIQIDIRMLSHEDLARSLDATRPTIVSANQRLEFLVNASRREENLAYAQPDRLSALNADYPRLSVILLASGERKLVQSLNEYAYIVGYRPLAEGPNPVIEVQKTGVRTDIRAMAESSGIRIINAKCLRSKLVEITSHEAVTSVSEGGEKTISWEELAVRMSQTTFLPEAGILIPPGGSLLLPATSGHIQSIKPGGVTTAEDSSFSPWWVLITPLASPPVEAPEPVLPSARS